MGEVMGAVIATSLVLATVFVPVALFPGTTGRLYQQFALTIAVSVGISAFVALTLTPALSAILLRKEPKKGAFFRARDARHRRLRRGLSRGAAGAGRLEVDGDAGLRRHAGADGVGLHCACRPASCPTKIRATS